MTLPFAAPEQKNVIPACAGMTLPAVLGSRSGSGGNVIQVQLTYCPGLVYRA